MDAVAAHTGGSWAAAATLLLTALVEHPSRSQPLAAAGLQLFGAFLRRTVAKQAYATAPPAANESSKRSSAARPLSSAAVGSKVATLGVPFFRGASSPAIGSLASAQPSAHHLGGSDSGLLRTSLWGVGLDAASVRQHAATGDSRSGGGGVWRLGEAEREGAALGDRSDAVDSVLRAEGPFAAEVGGVASWGVLSGGGRTVQRALAQLARERGGALSDDVYGALLELCMLSDDLVATATARSWSRQVCMLSDRPRGLLPKARQRKARAVLL